MKRKLIKQGSGGLTICLPKNWTDSYKLKAGDEVDIQESGDYIIMSAKIIGNKQISLQFNIEDLDFLSPAITHCYRLGYDKITIETNEIKLINLIENEIINLLLGFEIVEKNKKGLILENISEPAEDKFEVMLRRIFLIIQGMAEELINNKINLQDKKNQIAKLCFFCKRTLNKKINTFHNPFIYWELITYLMTIAHGYYYLGIALKNKKLDKNSLDYLIDVNNYFLKLYNSFYQKNTKIISSMNKDKKDLVFTRPDSLINKNSLIQKIQYIARMIQLCSGSVLYAIIEVK